MGFLKGTEKILASAHHSGTAALRRSYRPVQRFGRSAFHLHIILGANL